MTQIALKLTQKMVLSQMQRLTIQVLALRGQDMREFLQDQVMNNPLLDIQYKDVYSHTGRDAGEKPIQQIKAYTDSWEEKLMKQLRLQHASKEVMLAAGLVIQNLDEKGFFTDNLADIGEPYGLPADIMQAGLELVQELDPAGIGAQSMRQCLLLQARRRSDVPRGAIAVLTAWYDEFLHGKWNVLQENLHISGKELQQIRDFLKSLSLQPIAGIDEKEEYIRPDVEIYCDASGMLCVRSLEELPEIFFRQDLYTAYAKQGDAATTQFIKKAKRQFLDLQSALAYRWKSIFTVMTYIASRQAGYFLESQELRPLLQRDIAKGTGLSTATVSRVCRNRYVLFRQRVLPFQSFLAHPYGYLQGEDGQISDKAIMAELSALIQQEDKAHPLSDQAITDWFQNKNITIARRTVAKFRAQLQIPNSTMRKRIHALDSAD